MGIKVKGFDRAVKNLRSFGVEGDKIVKREINISASSIELGAIQRAPNTIGGIQTGIKQRINKQIVNGGFGAKVGVEGSDPFPAYVEFGTGSNFTDLVNARPDLYDENVKAIAREFYVNGKGTLKAYPYLFPAFFEERVVLVRNLKLKLTELIIKTIKR